ncbi:MAG: Membrane protease subunit, stomatin/prohibitin [candidate division TM6 bacterium GW2011_GWF2_32_72]|nr:MAG: Membrane protease subunit, stomatin/prohibitin [candidate division TM6 bacterium GW2011_GWF2_32_72]
MNYERITSILLTFFIFLIAAGALLFQSFYIVQPGYSALQLRLGKIVNMQNAAGGYLKVPFLDKVIFINNRICKSVIETTALSKDLQSVSIGVAINYQIENALKLYEAVGTDFEKVIIDPFAQESIKAVVAKYTAEDLIQFRHEAKEKVSLELRDRLGVHNIRLIDFNFVHSDFSPDFIKAVEDKQIAEQSAKMAKNLTEKVKEEAIQTRARAEAEAYAMKIKKESATKELIELQNIEAQLKAINKWDGKLPQVSGGATPFINLNR